MRCNRGCNSFHVGKRDDVSGPGSKSFLRRDGGYSRKRPRLPLIPCFRYRRFPLSLSSTDTISTLLLRLPFFLLLSLLLFLSSNSVPSTFQFGWVFSRLAVQKLSIEARIVTVFADVQPLNVEFARISLGVFGKHDDEQRFTVQITLACLRIKRPQSRDNCIIA